MVLLAVSVLMLRTVMNSAVFSYQDPAPLTAIDLNPCEVALAQFWHVAPGAILMLHRGADVDADATSEATICPSPGPALANSRTALRDAWLPPATWSEALDLTTVATDRGD